MGTTKEYFLEWSCWIQCQIISNARSIYGHDNKQKSVQKRKFTQLSTALFQWAHTLHFKITPRKNRKHELLEQLRYSVERILKVGFLQIWTNCLFLYQTHPSAMVTKCNYLVLVDYNHFANIYRALYFAF